MTRSHGPRGRIRRQIRPQNGRLDISRGSSRSTPLAKPVKGPSKARPSRSPANLLGAVLRRRFIFGSEMEFLPFKKHGETLNIARLKKLAPNTIIRYMSPELRRDVQLFLGYTNADSSLTITHFAKSDARQQPEIRYVLLEEPISVPATAIQIGDHLQTVLFEKDVVGVSARKPIKPKTPEIHRKGYYQ